MPKTKERASDRQARTERKAEDRVNELRGRPIFERRPTTEKRVRGIRGDAGEGSYREAIYRNNSRFFGIDPGPGPVSDRPKSLGLEDATTQPASMVKKKRSY